MTSSVEIKLITGLNEGKPTNVQVRMKDVQSGKLFIVLQASYAKVVTGANNSDHFNPEGDVRTHEYLLDNKINFDWLCESTSQTDPNRFVRISKTATATIIFSHSDLDTLALAENAIEHASIDSQHQVTSTPKLRSNFEQLKQALCEQPVKDQETTPAQPKNSWVGFSLWGGLTHVKASIYNMLQRS